MTVKSIAIATALIFASFFGVIGLGAGKTVFDANASVGFNGTFVRPLSGYVISQPFGCTTFPLEPYDAACQTLHFHSGIDLAAPIGTPVYATGPGVATVSFMEYGYGLYITIDHGNGLDSLYGHLSDVAIANGQKVSGGQLIGYVGSTGNSTGPHLHFEIDRDGIPEDPQLDVPL